jgi:hypothetical protein
MLWGLVEARVDIVLLMGSIIMQREWKREREWPQSIPAPVKLGEILVSNPDQRTRI